MDLPKADTKIAVSELWAHSLRRFACSANRRFSNTPDRLICLIGGPNVHRSAEVLRPLRPEPR